MTLNAIMAPATTNTAPATNPAGTYHGTAGLMGHVIDMTVPSAIQRFRQLTPAVPPALTNAQPGRSNAGHRLELGVKPPKDQTGMDPARSRLNQSWRL
jgi:hypothetical protein